MVEWSITAVLKTAVRRRTGGSNPSLSARLPSIWPALHERYKAVFLWFRLLYIVRACAGRCQSSPGKRKRVGVSKAVNTPFNVSPKLANSVFPADIHCGRCADGMCGCIHGKPLRDRIFQTASLLRILFVETQNGRLGILLRNR